MAPETAPITFLPQGGIIQTFNVSGHNIVLGFTSPGPYASRNTAYFGETIGRVANRISGARLEGLNGASYPLTANDGPNTLHGGPQGWGKRTFDGPHVEKRMGRDATRFTYRSAHLEEGFPGTVEMRLWYFTSVEQEPRGEVTSLEIEYEVELVGDEVEETAVNVTNHSYFNIGPEPTIAGTRVRIPSNLHLPVDEGAIPTGQMTAYEEIPADTEVEFGPDAPAPDHCFISDPDYANVPLDTRTRDLRLLAAFHHPATHIRFEALSTEPAFQLYDGKFIDVPVEGDERGFGARGGFCVEASRYVNAVNMPEWRHMVVLRKDQLWGSRTVYRAWRE